MKYDSNLAQLHDKLTAFLQPLLVRAERLAASTAAACGTRNDGIVGNWVNREMAASDKRELAYLRRVAAAVETHFDDLTEEA